MDENNLNSNLPGPHLVIELDPSLNRLVQMNERLEGSIVQEVSKQAAELLEDLGIPGVPNAQVGVEEVDTDRSGQFLRLRVDGETCRYPDELIRLTYSYAAGSYPTPEDTPSKILAWLLEAIESGMQDRAVEFLSLLCLGILKRHPGVLLSTADQINAYRASLPAVAAEDTPGPGLPIQDPARLLSILKQVLGMQISIADRQTVADVLGRARDRKDEDIVEDLVAALRPDVIEIHLPIAYLRELTTLQSGDGPGMFKFLKEGMYQELGMEYPLFKFRPVETLKPGCFAFKINHLITTPPVLGLQPDQCLVNDMPERLRYIDVQAWEATNPASGQPGSLISIGDKERVDAEGLTTWDPLGHLILCFAEVLRGNSAFFVDSNYSRSQLDQQKVTFPDLVKAVRAKTSGEDIARVLRALVVERVSLRNLKPILERLVDDGFGLEDPSQSLVLYDLPSTLIQPGTSSREDSTRLVSFVREGLKRQIASSYVRDMSPLVVYLLDREIEDQLSEHESRGERDLSLEERLINAVRIEIAYLPPAVQIPCILTSIQARPIVKQLLSHEFPTLAVLAYEELRPDMKIQPAARITLGG